MEIQVKAKEIEQLYKKLSNSKKRSREEFERQELQQSFYEPIVQENKWPKYLGTFNTKIKMFGIMPKTFPKGTEFEISYEGKEISKFFDNNKSIDPESFFTMLLINKKAEFEKTPSNLGVCSLFYFTNKNFFIWTILLEKKYIDLKIYLEKEFNFDCIPKNKRRFNCDGCSSCLANINMKIFLNYLAIEDNLYRISMQNNKNNQKLFEGTSKNEATNAELTLFKYGRICLSLLFDLCKIKTNIPSLINPKKKYIAIENLLKRLLRTRFYFPNNKIPNPFFEFNSKYCTTPFLPYVSNVNYLSYFSKETIILSTDLLLSLTNDKTLTDKHINFILEAGGTVVIKEAKEEVVLKINEKEKRNNTVDKPIISTAQKELIKRNLDADEQYFSDDEKNKEKVNNKMNELLGNDDAILKEANQPELLKTELKKYQKQALSWMLFREDHIAEKEAYENKNDNTLRELDPIWQEMEFIDGSKIYFNPFIGEFRADLPKAKKTNGGILADEMGLGKTITSLSLIVSTIEKQRNFQKENSNGGGTLVIVPPNLINTWKTEEINKHKLSDVLKVSSYHGINKKSIELKNYDIVLTSYEGLGKDFKEFVEDENKNNEDETNLMRINWFRVILDEAHKIKNKSSLQAKGSFEINALYKWGLTGTPIQNKIDDLFSILHYLKVDIFGNWYWWNTYLNNGDNESDTFDLIRQIINPLFLRRTKNSTFNDGQKILELPNSHFEIVLIELNQAERKIYNLLFKNAQRFFSDILKKDTVGNNYLHIFSILIKLRQLCDHIFLAFPGLNENNFDSEDNDLENIIRKFFANSATQINSEEYQKEVIQNIKDGQITNCPICFEEKEMTISTCGHSFCFDCITRYMKNNHQCPFCRKNLEIKDIKFIKEIEEENVNLSKFDFNILENSSSKTVAVLKEINKIKEKNEKVLVFSQWLGMIAIIEKTMIQNNIEYLKIVGGMTANKRIKILDSFTNNTNITVLIISLGTGSLGLNLTTANHVFIVDPWWNPAVESQAIHRIYRIGQNKEVFIKRFICKNTIEERVLELHKKKNNIIENTIFLNKSEIKKQNVEDIHFIFS